MDTPENSAGITIGDEKDETFATRILAANAGDGGIIDPDLEAEVSAASGDALDAIGARFNLVRAADHATEAVTRADKEAALITFGFAPEALAAMSDKGIDVALQNQRDTADAAAKKPALNGTEDGGEPPEVLSAFMTAALTKLGVPPHTIHALTPTEAAKMLDALGSGVDEAPVADSVITGVAEEVAADIQAGKIAPEPAPAVVARGLIRTGKLSPEDAAKAHVKTFAHMVAQLAALAEQTGTVRDLVDAQRAAAVDRGDDAMVSMLSSCFGGLNGTVHGIRDLLAEL